LRRRSSSIESLSEDGKFHRFIYSEEVGVNSKSFCDSRMKYNKNYPPPKYFTDQELLTNFHLPTNKDEILKNLVVPH